MRRRAFLAVLAAGSAGCSSAFGSSDPPRLDGPTVETDDGTAYYNFSRDGEAAVNLDVSVRPEDRTDPTAPARVVVSVGGQGEWTTTGVRLALRAPATLAAGQHPAQVFLDVSDPAAALFSTETADDGYTAVEAADLDASAADSTLVLTFRLVPRSPAAALSLRAATTHRGPDDAPARVDFADTVSLRPG
jgi:hypothetical protein